jgi:hypothetical protein
MATQKQILENIIVEIAKLKADLPNGNIVKIEQSIADMHTNQKEMKEDIRTMQKRLFNPDSGLIVETNKNTEFRETCEPERGLLIEQFKGVLRWKKAIEWGLGVIYVAAIGAIIKYLIG